MPEEVPIVTAAKVELFGNGRAVFSHLRRLGLVLAGTRMDIVMFPLTLEYKGKTDTYYACRTELKAQPVEGYVLKSSVQTELEGGG